MLLNEVIAFNRAVQLEETLKKRAEDLESTNKILKDSFERKVFRILTEQKLLGRSILKHSFPSPPPTIPPKNEYK